MSMTLRHTTEQERVLYVMDALDPDQRERVEAHLLGCPSCQEAVMAEARVEVKLRELWTKLPAETVEAAAAPRPLITEDHPALSAARRPQRHMALWALSAAVVLVLLWRAEPPRLPQPVPSQARHLRTDSPFYDSQLTSEEPAGQDEALACNQLGGQRLCTADGTAAPAAATLSSLEPAACESVGTTASDETACLLPATAGASERARTCGP